MLTADLIVTVLNNVGNYTAVAKRLHNAGAVVFNVAAAALAYC